MLVWTIAAHYSSAEWLTVWCLANSSPRLLYVLDFVAHHGGFFRDIGADNRDELARR